MMPTFEYEALDASGKSKRGVVSADNARQARGELRRLKLTPIGITEPKAKTGGARYAIFGLGGHSEAHISASALVSITRQLAVLVDASMPLEEALNAVAMQADSSKVRTRLLAVREGVIEGRRLSDSLGDDPKSFPSLYRAVVAAGESSGDLGLVLERLATMLEKNRAMKNKAIAALIYPAALAVFAGGIITALMALVVPKIIEQFDSFDAELPLITQIVVAMSGFIRDYGLMSVAIIALIFIGVWRARRETRVRIPMDKWVLGVPIIGRLARGLDGAQFARTLSTLFSGGAPLLDSLAGAQRTVSNAYIKQRLDTTLTMVREGATLAAGLRRANALPSLMTHMVAAGERAGSLPKLLDKTAEQLEEEFETASTVALRLLEPLIIFTMGGMVLVIVLSILLPIMKLNSLVSG